MSSKTIATTKRRRRKRMKMRRTMRRDKVFSPHHTHTYTATHLCMPKTRLHKLHTFTSLFLTHTTSSYHHLLLLATSKGGDDAGLRKNDDDDDGADGDEGAHAEEDDDDEEEEEEEENDEAVMVSRLCDVCTTFCDDLTPKYTSLSSGLEVT